jgi:hypothetical protein
MAGDRGGSCHALTCVVLHHLPMDIALAPAAPSTAFVASFEIEP